MRSRRARHAPATHAPRTFFFWSFHCFRERFFLPSSMPARLRRYFGSNFFMASTLS